ncbi:hypothetical protein BAY61_30615 [Prauserella marina]|uniref:DUF2334 domain-containing protein n=1 Tax=Prauserella marina TaxID=530584 RepID=UPI000B81597A|nr:DUF2334 domain-containing protein [Prauserella marina]ASR38631.1 hypothetical protein BAY61_30615 [Prauserella marina]
MDATLLVSLSGIGPACVYRCADLATELDRRRLPLSLLCTPGLVSGCAETSGWLRARVAGGDAVLLHGYDPRVRTEFASLPAHEAGLRLIAAMAGLDRLGLQADAFAPPGWLCSAGTVRALRGHGFRQAAELTVVRDLEAGTVVKSRVRAFEERRPWENRRCSAFVAGARRSARRGGVVRLAVSGTDLASPCRRAAILDAVDAVLGEGAVGRGYPALRTGHTDEGSPLVRTLSSVPSGLSLVKRS